MQRVDHPDPAAANAQALHDLENGATGLTLVFAGSLNANGYGLDGSPRNAGARARRRLSRCRRRHRSSTSRRRPATPPKHFAALVKRRGIAPDSGRPARRHQSARRNGGDRAAARCRGASSRRPSRRSSRSLPAQGFRGPFAVADGRVIHNAGGSEAQELAFALASAVAYLRALEAGGIALDARAPHDLFPARRGRRPVPHHREVPRDAEAVGARRAGLRPRARAGLRRRRDRVAHDDAARSVREHAAHHDRGVRRRPRRGGRDRGAAVHRGARPARRASPAASRATRSSSCWRNRISRRWPTRRPDRAASRT